MKQLFQQLKDGKIKVEDLPSPQISANMIIVRNHFSMISPGTESSTILTARKTLFNKAKSRPADVEKVIKALKKMGLTNTIKNISRKLEDYSPLGYSSSGEVLSVGSNVEGFRIGDKVACAGAGFANHAEIISVPQNLCVKLNDNADLLLSSYNTLGAIAMQGVRQANLQIGEVCSVIGLGLVGQLTSVILKASGVEVIGIDISSYAINLSRSNNSCDYVFDASEESIDEYIHKITSGQGVDSSIVTAASSSTDPINLAGKITRKKGSVVIVGDVPTGFDRNPDWYPKELELRMSCSYGPGRYDTNYEEKSIDYPYAYVRWTEKRNMESFQNLIFNKKIDIDYLTTHKFTIDEAPKAYELIIDSKFNCMGVALKYDISKNVSDSKIKLINNDLNPNSRIGISFIGTGNYAQSNLLPHIKNNKYFIKNGILSRTGTTSKKVAKKFKFKFCTSRIQDILDNTTDIVFISTRHNTHAEYILKALENSKNIFVEKPLCLNKKELELIIDKKNKSNNSIMVGFNRRFSSFTEKIKKHLDDQPISMIYRINAGKISKSHWIQDLEIGGGRIIGEVCHFIDYLTFINGSLPSSVSAVAIPDQEGLNDCLNILLSFKNGSSGVISYLTNGSELVSKEYIEIYCNCKTIILNDFKELNIFDKNKRKRFKKITQDKGQKKMINTFLENQKDNQIEIIPFEEIVTVTKTCFKILDSIKNEGKKNNIN